MKPLRDYIPPAKWEAWKPLDRQERALQIAAYLCDVLKPRETNGRNRGEVIDAITRQAGYDPADRLPYCAMFVTACLTLAGYNREEIPSAPGAVRHWATYAQSPHTPHTVEKSPARGDLCYWLNANGTGHIGFVVRPLPLTVLSIEANTSSGEAGSQRDGDGVFRRVRLRRTWHGYIRLPK